MKTLGKKALFGAIALLAASNMVLYCSMKNTQDDRDSWKSIARSSLGQATYWRNKEGLAQASAEVSQANAKAIKEAYGRELESTIKQVKGLRKDLENLNAYIAVSLQSHGEVKAPVRDTVILAYPYDTARAFTYRDKWASIKGYVLRDTAVVSYRTTDSLKFVAYWKKNGLFKDRALMMDVVSQNPNTDIKNLKGATVPPPRRPRIVIGPFIGIGHDLRPVIGIGATYRIFGL